VQREQSDSVYELLRDNLKPDRTITCKLVVAVNDGAGVAALNNFRESLDLESSSRLKVVEMSFVSFTEAFSLLKRELPFLDGSRIEKILRSLQQESGSEDFVPWDLFVLTSTLGSRPPRERKLAARGEDEVGLIRACFLDFLEKRIQSVGTNFRDDILLCLSLLANSREPLRREDLIAATNSGDRSRFSSWFPTIEVILRQVNRAEGESTYTLFSSVMRESIRRRFSVPMNTLVTKFEVWKQGEDHDFLLKSSELSIVRRNFDEFKSKAPGSERYLQVSRKNLRWLALRTVAIVALSATVVLTVGWSLAHFKGSGTGLPAGMLAASKNVKKVRVGEGVRDLSWLPKNIEALNVSQTSQIEMFTQMGSLRELILDYSSIPMQEDLSRAPRGLRRLSMSGIPVRSLRGSPPNLELLEILGSQLGDFRGLPQSLRDLRVHGASSDLRFTELPEGLLELTIAESLNLRSIEHLPSSLRALTLDGTNLKNLPELPVSLERLEVINNPDPKFIVRELPERLRSFSARGVNLSSALAWPTSLRELELDRVPSGDLPAVEHLKLILSAYDNDAVASLRIPASVRDLALSSQTSLVNVNLPEHLRRLALDWVGDEFIEFRLPDDLKSLEVRNLAKVELLGKLPQNLEDLLMFGDFTEVGELPRHLRSLRLSSRALRRLPDLPDTLEQLDISECVSLEALTLPKTLKVLRMGGVPLGVQNWPPALSSLVIVNTPIDRIMKWPETLRRLHFGEGQLRELRRAPGSLVEISVSSEIDPWKFPE
jgi:Leucine-rich repeat (LRR) protein